MPSSSSRPQFVPRPEVARIPELDAQETTVLLVVTQAARLRPSRRLHPPSAEDLGRRRRTVIPERGPRPGRARQAHLGLVRGSRCLVRRHLGPVRLHPCRDPVRLVRPQRLGGRLRHPARRPHRHVSPQSRGRTERRARPHSRDDGPRHRQDRPDPDPPDRRGGCRAPRSCSDRRRRGTCPSRPSLDLERRDVDGRRDAVER